MARGHRQKTATNQDLATAIFSRIISTSNVSAFDMTNFLANLDIVSRVATPSPAGQELREEQRSSEHWVPLGFGNPIANGSMSDETGF